MIKFYSLGIFFFTFKNKIQDSKLRWHYDYFICLSKY